MGESNRHFIHSDLNKGLVFFFFNYSISSFHNFKSNDLNLKFEHKIKGILKFNTTLYDLYLL